MERSRILKTRKIYAYRIEKANREGLILLNIKINFVFFCFLTHITVLLVIVFPSYCHDYYNNTIIIIILIIIIITMIMMMMIIIIIIITMMIIIIIIMIMMMIIIVSLFSFF